MPLTDTNAISTRGQNLPALMHVHSHSSLSGLSRRPSTLRSRERRGSQSSNEDDLESYRHGLTMPWGDRDRDEHRASIVASILNTPQMRSQRLIGNSNPRYKWEKYYKSEEELKRMKKPIREYYERNNYLIQHYMYIDRLLDSSLPHTLIQEYSQLESGQVNIPSTIKEESSTPSTTTLGHITPGGLSEASSAPQSSSTSGSNGSTQVKVKRTPKNLYKVPEHDESTPLLSAEHAIEIDEPDSPKVEMPEWEPEEDEDTESPIVKLAINVNLAANTALLILKIIVTIMTSSLSVIASLVDAALDFLSTAIVWTTAFMIARQDQYAYPVGRRKLEPIGVLVFSIVMITSFFQVAIEGFSRLTGNDHTIVQLTIPAVAIMASTVIIKFLCWLWCRLIRNSSVQALAQDAMTDVVFNIFSIIFPLSKSSVSAQAPERNW